MTPVPTPPTKTTRCPTCKRPDYVPIAAGITIGEGQCETCARTRYANGTPEHQQLRRYVVVRPQR